jgi:anti-sigma B factor antagonist
MQRHSCFLTPRPVDHTDVTLSGDIDILAADDLAHVLRDVVRINPKSIRVDLQAVSFFSAAGINFLATLHKLAAEQHAALTVLGAPLCVKRLLDLCGLDDLLPALIDAPSRTAAVS